MKFLTKLFFSDEKLFFFTFLTKLLLFYVFEKTFIFYVFDKTFFFIKFFDETFVIYVFDKLYFYLRFWRNFCFLRFWQMRSIMYSFEENKLLWKTALIFLTKYWFIHCFTVSIYIWIQTLQLFGQLACFLQKLLLVIVFFNT